MPVFLAAAPCRGFERFNRGEKRAGPLPGVPVRFFRGKRSQNLTVKFTVLYMGSGGENRYLYCKPFAQRNPIYRRI